MARESDPSWTPGTRVWAAETAYYPGKYHDLNIEFGIVMPAGTPALGDPPDFGEPGPKTVEPPEPGMVPIHWNHVSKCSWEHPATLVTELHPEVMEETAGRAADARRRETLRSVSSTRKRLRRPALTVTIDEDLKERVDQALDAVDSTYREHAIAFLRWLIRDTDELPPRPDYPLPYFKYGE
ncbi:hypothetical protein ACFVMC_26585 [Nocardia sp. NPDC127579]|uniref:hypothetical protein n=1 Tax=Nocardia sp. NPDC127579 TaxID=3345402 RepID=UPI00362AEE1C